MPRLYREAPLNSIWEGSGNVTALDVLRALGRAPGSADARAGRDRPRRGRATAGSTRRPRSCARSCKEAGADSRGTRPGGWPAGSP